MTRSARFDPKTTRAPALAGPSSPRVATAVHETALELRDLTGRSPLGSLGATFPINLRLQPGQCGVILGGKETSSLFRLIMGSGEVHSGQLILEGRHVRDHRSTQDGVSAWRQRIGFAFREKGLLSNLTLLDNVDLPAKYHGRYEDGAAPRSIAEAAMRDLDVDPAVWHVRPSRISWEVRKKVLLARSLVLDPPLLILDDPSALMASPSLPGLLRWIRRQLAGGRAVLVGTNDYPVGLAIADWILHPITNQTVTTYDDFVDQPWIDAARLLASQVRAQGSNQSGQMGEP